MPTGPLIAFMEVRPVTRRPSTTNVSRVNRSVSTSAAPNAPPCTDRAADINAYDGSGYVCEDAVIAAAQAAGFELDARSEINANPKDTKDHPFGVWTLPPARRSSAMRGETDPNFDRAPYDAIGESDRMTLKFRKPLAADGALLE